jgi:NitT/TauT family transport system permease protein
VTGIARTSPSRSPDRRAAAATAAILRHYLPAAVVFVVVLLAWQAQTAGPGRRVIPAPTAILAALSSQRELLQTSALATLYEAIGGLAIGTLAGVAVAFATARWATARDLLFPIAIGASAIPLIAIAPILNNWFGVLDPISKMMMAALLVFFPITINVTRGLTEVDPSALELMRSYASGDWNVLRKVRIPNMLPFFFTALKVSTTLAFIGAIVGEFYGGTSEVLGRVVVTSISGGSFDVAWAAILLGSIAAFASYVFVSLVERAAIPWYTALRSGRG